MTQLQNAKYDTYERIIHLCQEHEATVNLLPVFKSDLADLNSKLPEILRLSSLINADNDVSDTKATAKDNMIALTLDVCANLGGYGIKTKDKSLEAIGKNSKSGLSLGKEEAVIERCQAIARKARELLEALKTTRGMPESLLTKLEAAIAEFRALKPAPRRSLQDKSALTAQLESVFEDADIALTLMIGSAVNFKELPAEHQAAIGEFLARFERATVTIAPKKAVTKVKFQFTDSLTKEKVTDVAITSGALNLAHTFMTDDARALNSSPHKGSDFTFTKEGYETATRENVHVKKGQITLVKVVMMPIEA